MFAKFFLVIMGFLHCANSFGATYDFSYSGRLVDSTGRPLDGPVALKASFFHSETGTTSILDVTTGLTQVPLSEGVFQIKLSLSDSDFQRVFPNVNQNVYIQITDLTHSANQPYDRQQLTILPYAGKIPIDTSQFSWDSLGQLHFTASTTADFSSAGPIGSTTPNTAIFTTVTTNKTSSATSGSVVNVTISPTYNQASGTAANTDLLINRTETAVGSGTQRLIDAQVGGTTRFNVSNTGNGYFAGNVGKGTTSPTLGKLQVNQTSDSVTGGMTVANSALSSALYLWSQNSTTGRIDAGSTGADNLVLNATGTGKVGIGTTSPQGSLHVAAANTRQLLLNRSDIGTGVSDGTYMSTSGGNFELINQENGYLRFYTNGADVMRIQADGNVGIGTTSPAATLDVANTIQITGGAATLQASGGSLTLSAGANSNVALSTTNGSLTIGNGGYLRGVSGTVGTPTYSFASDSNTGIYSGGADILRFVTGGSDRMTFDSAGNVGIGITNPSQKLAVGASGDGSVAIANSWTTYSDKRLKKNISVIDSALEKISALSGYFFHWKKGSDKSRQIGVMAQEVEKIFPELVKEGADGIKSVDYPKLAVPMLEAIKSLKGQVDQLKGENAMLKSYLCEKDPNAKFCEGSNE